MDDLVSVIIATYNRPTLLKRALRSVEKQTHKNLEVIIIDDCSNFSPEHIISQFKSLKFSLSNLNEKVFIKLVTNALNDKILGLHYVGENAAEIVQGFSVAVVNGLTKKQLDKTIGIHPTCAEEIVTLRNK